MKKEGVLSFIIRYRVAMPSFDNRFSIPDMLRFVFLIAVDNANVDQPAIPPA